MVSLLVVTSFLVELLNAHFEDPARNGAQEERREQAKETTYSKDRASNIGHIKHYYGKHKQRQSSSS